MLLSELEVESTVSRWRGGLTQISRGRGGLTQISGGRGGDGEGVGEGVVNQLPAPQQKTITVPRKSRSENSYNELLY